MNKVTFCVAVLLFFLFFFGCDEVIETDVHNQPPVEPEVVEPQQMSDVSVDVTLRWICADPDGDVIKYDVYIDGKRVSQGQIAGFYKPDVPLSYKRYYTWYVVAYDTEGNTSKMPQEGFTTERERVVLVNERVNVSAWTYKYWELQLEGGWETSGNILSDSEVNVWFLSQREFDAFRRGETFYSYEDASKKRALSFSFTFMIPETANYYLVLDNKFSWITSKSVMAYFEALK